MKGKYPKIYSKSPDIFVGGIINTLKGMVWSWKFFFPKFATEPQFVTYQSTSQCVYLSSI